jgi:hypothetical protein
LPRSCSWRMRSVLIWRSMEPMRDCGNGT